MKRALDIVLSSIGLIALSPLFLAVALLIKLDSEGPVFFRQERVGRDFRPFRILKFRTMVHHGATQGPSITVGGDVRVTRTGRVLRKYKIDELPQLFNVLRGDMSLVGPRPEVREYVELFRSQYQDLLTSRPGITDPASLRFSCEEDVLAGTADWREEYVRRILPEKIRLSREYMRRRTLSSDIKLMAMTVLGTSPLRRSDDQSA